MAVLGAIEGGTVAAADVWVGEGDASAVADVVASLALV